MHHKHIGTDTAMQSRIADIACKALQSKVYKHPILDFNLADIARDMTHISYKPVPMGEILGERQKRLDAKPGRIENAMDEYITSVLRMSDALKPYMETCKRYGIAIEGEALLLSAADVIFNKEIKPGFKDSFFYTTSFTDSRKGYMYPSVALVADSLLEVGYPISIALTLEYGVLIAGREFILDIGFDDKPVIAKENLGTRYVLTRYADTGAFLAVEHNVGADLLFDNGLYNDAIGGYDQALDIMDSYYDAKYSKACSLLRIGKDASAVRLFDELLDVWPRWHGAMLHRAAALFEIGDSSAMKNIDNLIEIYPNMKEAYFIKGNALKDSNPSESLEEYRKALNIDPKYYSAALNMGMVLCKLDRYESAESILRYIVTDIDENSSKAWFGRYIALDMLGKNKEAADAYNRAIELDPSLKLIEEDEEE